MTADLASRIKRAQEAMTAAGVDALIVTPGADLRYLTGYAAMPLERLTALILPVTGDPVLLVPELEAPEAEAIAGGTRRDDNPAARRARRRLRRGAQARWHRRDPRGRRPHVGHAGVCAERCAARRGYSRGRPAAGQPPAD